MLQHDNHHDWLIIIATNFGGYFIFSHYHLNPC